MARKDHVEIFLADDPVEMGVTEGQSGTCTPVSQQAIFDVFRFQGLLQEGIVLKVDHSQRKVITGSPECVNLLKFVCGKGLISNR